MLIAQRVVLYIALWTAIGLVFTSQAYFMRGDLWRSMLSVMPRWYAWAALAPLAFWVDRRWLRAYTLGVRLLTLVPVGAVLVFGVEVIRYEASIWLLGPAQQSFGRFLLVGSYWDFLIYTVVMGLYIAWTLSAEAQQRQLREASLEARLAEARLQTLQAQLNPHFLFNALNTVSAYTETDPPTARRMMAHLGNLLRASLDHADRQEVPLHRELDFLDAYLAIEQARFQDRLTVSLDVADDVRDVLVPTFMLQPLVENAIRHGINTRMRGGHIAIRAWRTEDRVRIVVDDDGTGLPDGWRLEDHAGVGLANTQRRLRELYGAAHRLYVQPQVEGGVRVEIALPIRCARTASSPHSTPRIA
ncbi:MAG: histidine kinase [Rhodothermales bacterium]